MGNRPIFLKTFGLSLNKDLTSELNFGQIHLAGQSLTAQQCSYLGLSSSTGSSLAREMLDITITSMMKLSNNFLVTNQ